MVEVIISSGGIMKYLTKQWYELSQLTFLHIGMKVLKEANRFDDSLFRKLYKEAENQYVETEREAYNVDPRYMLEHDGSTLISLDRYVLGEQLSDEDIMIYDMPKEEKKHIQKLINEFDSRLPFNEEKCREDFIKINRMIEDENKKRIPPNIYDQIADPRVFALGYCTKSIYNQLKKISKENMKKANLIVDEYSKAQMNEIIPDDIKEKLSFHDCKVKDFKVDGKDAAMIFDIYGQMATYDRVVFKSAKIISQESEVIGSYWIHNEIYCVENGYEVHILLDGEGTHELTISCENIVI